MIIPTNTKPEKSLYVIGSKILKIMKESNMGTWDINYFYSMYCDSCKKQERASFNYFVFALIWLNLINLVDANEDGKIEKCF